MKLKKILMFICKLFKILSSLQAEDSWFSKKCKLVNLTNNSVFSFLTPSFLKKDEGKSELFSSIFFFFFL